MVDYEKCIRHFEHCDFLGYKDLVLLPLYSLVIFFFGYRFRSLLVRSNSPLKQYFIRGLTYKLAGAVAAGLIYQYYYKGGDTAYYWSSASSIYDYFFSDFDTAWKLLSPRPFYDHPELVGQDYCVLYIKDVKAWTVIRLAAVFNILSFDSYIPTSLFFACISFYGSWKMFTLLSQLFPQLVKEFFNCIFLVPSVLFWGSGIFKDTLTLSGLMLLVYHAYDMFVSRRFTPSNIIWIIVSTYVVSSIRSFFIVIMLPCMFLWYFVSYRDKIRNRTLRRLAFPLMISISAVAIFVGFSTFIASSQEFNQQALQEKTAGMQQWHGSLGGSAYTLGDDNDFSLFGILKKFPAAVNVTLFRPYLWEVHSVFQFITAVQSLFFLFYTLRTIFKAGPAYFLTIVSSDSLVIFSLTFSIFYAFVSGFTSYNFGALDRYKIPCLSFYMVAMVVINFKAKIWKQRSA
ncbi:MAG: hypothetical protein U0T73_03035 [Chitinophagales bacterium]